MSREEIEAMAAEEMQYVWLVKDIDTGETIPVRTEADARAAEASGKYRGAFKAKVRRWQA